MLVCFLLALIFLHKNIQNLYCVGLISNFLFNLRFNILIYI